MALIRVFGNTYLNPHWVGRVEFAVEFPGTKRTNTTTVYDSTGKNEIAVFTTTISLEKDNPDKNAAVRDNHTHAEIVRSISLGRDAVGFAEDEHKPS